MERFFWQPPNSFRKSRTKTMLSMTSSKFAGHSRHLLVAALSLVVTTIGLGQEQTQRAAIGGQPKSRFTGPVAGWPSEVRAVEYLSAADNTLQPALFYAPKENTSARPLLVALHSWSGDYTQANPAYGLWCIAKQWVMVHPNFRGINQSPSACGSELAVQDILSAVEYAKSVCKVDEDRIYLMGGSGGGYASLLMAGRAPKVWAGVSAWCPIYDLKIWHAETQERKLKYAEMLEKVCGGKPGFSPQVDEQYRVRSAAAWLRFAKQVNLSINTGITDGHNGSVPVSHTLNAFNDVVSKPNERISADTIANMVKQPSMPPALLQKIDDPLLQRNPALFRRVSGTAQVTIFQGGHDIIYEAGLSWLEHQQRGKPPVWNVPAASQVDLTKLDTAVGK